MVAVLLGGTSAALATPDFQHWWWGGSADRTAERVNPWGELCTMAFKIDAKGVPDTDPAVIAAREILGAIDFENLQIDQSRLEENRVQAAADLEKRGTRVDADADTISKSVAMMVLDGVRDRGLDPGHFTIGGDRHCGDDEGSRSDGN